MSTFPYSSERNKYSYELALWESAGNDFITAALGAAVTDPEALTQSRGPLFDTAETLTVEALFQCPDEDVISIRGLSRTIRSVRMRHELVQVVPAAFAGLDDSELEAALKETGQQIQALHAQYPVKGDHCLIQELHNGDDRAFEVLFSRHHPGLTQYLRKYTDDIELTEDIAQQTFMTAFRVFSDGSTEFDFTRKSFKAWLMVVGKNLLIDHARKLKRKPEVLVDIMGANPGDDGLSRHIVALVSRYASHREDMLEPEELFERKEELLVGKARMEQVLSVMDTLPTERANILRLRFIEGLGIGVVSEQLGIKPSVLKARQYRAIRALEAALQADGYGAQTASQVQTEAWMPDDAAAVMMEYIGRILPGEKCSRAWTTLSVVLGRITAAQAAEIVGTTPERIARYSEQFERYRQEAEIFDILKPHISDNRKRRTYAARLAGRVSRAAAARFLGSPVIRYQQTAAS